jgi:tripartite-type tricarboxylate transporter receptor subunit TctC
MGSRWIRQTDRGARRRAGIALVVVLLAAGAARAQDWPSRPVTLVVPYEAGGIVDLTARLMADHLAKVLPQPFVIENRAGAGGTIATQHVARAKPDGHTLLVASVAQIAIAPLIQEVKYDPVKDFAPVSMFSSGVIALAVNAEVAASNTAALIALAKGQPGKLAYSSAGFGSFSHLGGAMFASQAGLELLHVPYKGAVPAVQALLTGQVQVYVGNFAELHPLVQTGKIRILATATARRLADRPELPTIGETLPGFQMAGWQGLLAPAQTPAAVLARLEQEAVAAARSATAVARLKSISVNAVGSTSADFAASIARDLALYREVTRAAGLQKQN